MTLGVGAAALLALGGGAIALLDPAMRNGHLTAPGQLIFRRVGAAVLEGVFPSPSTQRDAALDAFLGRVDAVIAALPSHVQHELSRLLALLATSAGRRGLAGLAPSWEEASSPQVQAALEDMRTSPSSLRTQAYQALHDIAGAAYFSDRSAWTVLGYPGPVQI